MEDDQAHPVEHAGVDPLDGLVADLVVGQVPPPGQHVGLGEDRRGQALVRFVEGRRPDLEAVVARADRPRSRAWIPSG